MIALREKLQARIEAEPADSDEQLDSPSTHRAQVLRLPARWRAPVAAALAAGLALFILARPGEEPASTPSTPLDSSLALEAAPPFNSEAPASLTAPSQAAPIPDETLEPFPVLAQEPSPGELNEPPQIETSIAAQRVEMDPDSGSQQQTLETPFPEADEMELAVVLEYEMLADLDVIENLDLLEHLSILDGPEPL